jgi:hypothetical protein
MRRLLMALVAVAAFGGAARADLVGHRPRPRKLQPDEKACQSKQVGDACSLDGVAGECKIGTIKYVRDDDNVIDVEVILCRPKDANGEDKNKKKSSRGEGTEPFMLAFGLVALGAGVLGVRRRHRSS